MNEGCRCGGRWELELKNLRWKGHVGCAQLVCSECRCMRKWESSKKFRDNSYKVNKDVVCAWMCTGREGFERYSQFVIDWGIGKMNRSTFFSIQKIVKRKVMDEGDKVMQC